MGEFAPAPKEEYTTRQLEAMRLPLDLIQSDRDTSERGLRMMAEEIRRDNIESGKKSYEEMEQTRRRFAEGATRRGLESMTDDLYANYRLDSELAHDVSNQETPEDKAVRKQHDASERFVDELLGIKK